MKLCAVILNYCDADNCETLVRAIRDFAAIDCILLVDNDSGDDSWGRLLRHRSEKVQVCRSGRNGGYGYGNNCGVRYAAEQLGCDAALIVNPDVMFDNALVERLKAVLAQTPGCGVVSALQRDRYGREVAGSAWRIPTPWRYVFSTGMLLGRLFGGFAYTPQALHAQPAARVDCVAGSLLLVSTEAFAQCGGYDEDMFLYCEETTLGCKMKQAGYDTICCSDVHYRHLHGESIRKSIRSRVRQKRILLQSHHILLRRYLHATPLQLWADRVFAGIVLAETWARNLLWP